MTKLNAAGSALSYSTYLGGAGADEAPGSRSTRRQRLRRRPTIDAATDFPTTAAPPTTTHNGGNDAFVTKLNPAGTALAYSTFLGGTGIDCGRDRRRRAPAAAYVTGDTPTSATDFPTTPAPSTRPTTSSRRLRRPSSTLPARAHLLDLPRRHGHRQRGGIAVDGTAPPTSPATPQRGDRLPDHCWRIRHDPQRRPTTPSSTKLNSTGGALGYSTFLGGWFHDAGARSPSIGTSARTSPANHRFGTDFPTTAGGFDTTHNGGHRRFRNEAQRAGDALSYSTFLGGAQRHGLGIGSTAPAPPTSRASPGRRLPDHRRAPTTRATTACATGS